MKPETKQQSTTTVGSTIPHSKPFKVSSAAVPWPPGLSPPTVSGAVADMSTDMEQGAAADRPDTVQVLLFLLLPSF